MVGKNGSNFPMVGKIFRRFSNDWKTFSEAGCGNKRTKRETNEEEEGNARQLRLFLIIVLRQQLGKVWATFSRGREDNSTRMHCKTTHLKQNWIFESVKVLRRSSVIGAITWKVSGRPVSESISLSSPRMRLGSVVSDGSSQEAMRPPRIKAKKSGLYGMSSRLFFLHQIEC